MSKCILAKYGFHCIDREAKQIFTDDDNCKRVIPQTCVVPENKSKVPCLLIFERRPAGAQTEPYRKNPPNPAMHIVGGGIGMRALWNRLTAKLSLRALVLGMLAQDFMAAID